MRKKSGQFDLLGILILFLLFILLQTKVNTQNAQKVRCSLILLYGKKQFYHMSGMLVLTVNDSEMGCEWRPSSQYISC